MIARIEELKSEGRRTVMLLVSGADNKLRFVSLRFEDGRAVSCQSLSSLPGSTRQSIP